MYEIIVIFGFLSVFITFIVFLALKRWFYCWEGILKEKRVKKEYGFKSTNDSDFSPGYTQKFILVFEKLDGEIIKREVNPRKFKAAVVGTRYIKLRKSWKFKRRD
ncbi:MAG: hypothetical protein KAQ63_01205 [Candidatus Moranbacteria bacterium]|nr:hypothetical protein [Candidatus Moranbacteria bacterium]